MRALLAKLLLLSLLLSTLPLAGARSEGGSELASCKIPQVDTKQLSRIGWPKYPGLLEAKGSPKFLVVGVDFEDAPMTAYKADQIDDALELNRVTERYRFVSKGIFVPTFEVLPRWVRLPELSSHYGQDRNRVQFVEGEWSTHHLAHDVTNLLAGTVELSKYQGLLIFVSGGEAMSGAASYATILDRVITASSGGPGNYIVMGRGWEGEERVETWRPVVHEINHLLGLPDLYLYDPDGYWLGRTPGPFGQQAFVFDSASDSLGWNRWLNGWIPDNQILCLPEPSDLSKIYMSPANDGDEAGYQLVIIRISETKVLVINALNAQGYDSRTYENSVLTYLVDSSIKNGEGPVTLIPRPTPLTLAPLSPSLPDWERFKEAPLVPQSWVEYNEMLIVNESKLRNGALVAIYVGAAKEKKKSELLPKTQPETPQVSPTPTPPVKKTIICKKGKIKKKVTAVKPKCPKGYKKVG